MRVTPGKTPSASTRLTWWSCATKSRNKNAQPIAVSAVNGGRPTAHSGQACGNQVHPAERIVAAWFHALSATLRNMTACGPRGQFTLDHPLVRLSVGRGELNSHAPKTQQRCPLYMQRVVHVSLTLFSRSSGVCASHVGVF